MQTAVTVPYENILALSLLERPLAGSIIPGLRTSTAKTNYLDNPETRRDIADVVAADRVPLVMAAAAK